MPLCLMMYTGGEGEGLENKGYSISSCMRNQGEELNAVLAGLINTDAAVSAQFAKFFECLDSMRLHA